jgi:hypothetical protein
MLITSVKMYHLRQCRMEAMLFACFQRSPERFAAAEQSLPPAPEITECCVLEVM